MARDFGCTSDETRFNEVIHCVAEVRAGEDGIFGYEKKLKDVLRAWPSEADEAEVEAGNLDILEDHISSVEIFLKRIAEASNSRTPLMPYDVNELWPTLEERKTSRNKRKRDRTNASDGRGSVKRQKMRREDPTDSGRPSSELGGIPEHGMPRHSSDKPHPKRVEMRPRPRAAGSAGTDSLDGLVSPFAANKIRSGGPSPIPEHRPNLMHVTIPSAQRRLEPSVAESSAPAATAHHSGGTSRGDASPALKSTGSTKPTTPSNSGPATAPAPRTLENSPGVQNGVRRTPRTVPEIQASRRRLSEMGKVEERRIKMPLGVKETPGRKTNTGFSVSLAQPFELPSKTEIHKPSSTLESLRSASMSISPMSRSTSSVLLSGRSSKTRSSHGSSTSSNTSIPAPKARRSPDLSPASLPTHPDKASHKRSPSPIANLATVSSFLPSLNITNAAPDDPRLRGRKPLYSAHKRLVSGASIRARSEARDSHAGHSNMGLTGKRAPSRGRSRDLSKSQPPRAKSPNLRRPTPQCSQAEAVEVLRRKDLAARRKKEEERKQRQVRERRKHEEAEKRRHEQLEAKKRRKEERRRKLQEDRAQNQAQLRQKEQMKRAANKKRLQGRTRGHRSAKARVERGKIFKKPGPKHKQNGKSKSSNRPQSKRPRNGQDTKSVKSRYGHSKAEDNSSSRGGWICADTLEEDAKWAKPKPKKKRVRQYHCLKAKDPKKRFPPCGDGQDQYVMSDYDSEFESDQEEHLEESKKDRGKRRPTWARGEALINAVKEQGSIDTDSVFGSMLSRTVQLTELFPEAKFGEHRHKYRNRGKSADWSRDRLTWPEERNYKKQRGWKYQ